MQLHSKDPRTADTAGGVADEETVDMAERRDKPPEPEAGPHWPPLPPASRLSPVQEAWAAYVAHALECPICRSPDEGACEMAAQLHRDYEELGAAASQQVWKTP